MAAIDRDQEVKELAYFLWEKAGRPSGQEHHFWAEASKRIEGGNDDAGKETARRSVAR